jgi:hypothetical protein
VRSNTHRWTLLVVYSCSQFIALLKYPIAILALSLFLTACSHRSDAQIRKNLPGTWSVDIAADGTRCTFTIATNGDFVCRTTHGFELSGSFKIEDGFLVETVTRSSQTNARVPFVWRAQILQSDANQMVVTDDGTNRFVLKK